MTTPTGTRVPGLRLGHQRSHALLFALLIFRLQPAGFTNRDLRALTAQLRGLPPGTVTTGQMTYDLRRLRLHGLINKIPHTHRYRVNDQRIPPGLGSSNSPGSGLLGAVYRGVVVVWGTTRPGRLCGR